MQAAYKIIVMKKLQDVQDIASNSHQDRLINDCAYCRYPLHAGVNLFTQSIVRYVDLHVRAMVCGAPASGPT